ncbi:MAG: SUMF1/EgtB/PvdO family nonheme iron enzyme [Planctomycetes bacterium]|nr:SUMF1/EgtB/PvdO family nonheme iron enzyme [Planctomycetota bacterium]
MDQDPLLARAPVIEGFKVLDPAVLYAKVGTGGMGSVYRGRHLNLGCDVAVKVLRQDLAADEQYVQRFQREARLAVRIRNDNVVNVLDVRSRNGIHYLVMEFVDGETALQRVVRKGGLPEAEALAIIAGAVRGLRPAHSAGIVHRDIKPDNILISSSGAVKLADLGLAKQRHGLVDQSHATLQTGILGTPRYMPPEQWRSTDVSTSADVWAIGATLWFLLAGRHAIEERDLIAIADRIRDQDFPDLATVRPGLDAGVLALVARCTLRDPDSRYPDARELWRALQPLLGTDEEALVDLAAGVTPSSTAVATPPPRAALARIGVRVGDDPGQTRQLPGPLLRPESSDLRLGARRRRWPVIVGLLVLASALAGAFLVKWPASDSAGAVPANVEDPLAELRRQVDRAEDLDHAIERLQSMAPVGTLGQEIVPLMVSALRRRAGQLAAAEPTRALQLIQQSLELDAGDPAASATEAELRRVVAERLANEVDWRQPAGDSLQAGREVRVAGLFARQADCSLRVALVRAEADSSTFPTGSDLVAVREGAFAHDLVAPGDGNWRLRLQVAGPAGVSTELPPRRITIDSVPPSIVVQQPAQRRVRNPVRFEGSVDDTEARLTVGGRSVTPDPQGQWSVQIELPAGEQEVQLVAVDRLARRSTQSCRVAVAPATPIVEIVEAPPSTTSARVVRVRGRVEDPAHVELRLDDAIVPVGVDGSFEQEWNLPGDGEHRFRLVATDELRKETSREFVVRCDATPPVLEVRQPPPLVVAGQVTLSGTVRDSSACQVTVGEAVAEVVGEEWRVGVDVASPGTEFVVTARDALGNEAAPVHIALRTEVPDAELEWATREPDAVPVEIEGRAYPSVVRVRGTDLRLRLIRPSAHGFEMGAGEEDLDAEGDERRHVRRMRKPYWLGETEVTQQQWYAVLGERPSLHTGDSLPVDSVSWRDGQRFVRALAERCGDREFRFRLPSEAEWEYACRAGGSAAFLVDVASIHHGAEAPREAGASAANAWGFRDMHGNVWEWCADAWAEYPLEGTEDPAVGVGPRVLRGGSWQSPLPHCRASNRFPAEEWSKRPDAGLRVARTL